MSEYSSSLSEHTGVHSKGASSHNEEGGVLSLAQSIFRRVAIGDDAELSLQAHRLVAERMVRLYELLKQKSDAGESVQCRESQTTLLFATRSVQRRLLLCSENSNGCDGLERTRTLLFLLVVFISNGGQQKDESDVKRSMGTLDEFLESTLSSCMGVYSSSAFPCIPSVCRACLCAASKLDIDEPHIDEIAKTFVRCSQISMAYDLLHTGDKRFLSLSAIHLLAENAEDRDARLAGMVDIAESEAGQIALRDLLLSFILPIGLLGARRSIQLQRDCSQTATQKHPPEMQLAHDVAMRGARYTWDEDTNLLHKSCAILAGLAVHYGGGGTTNDVTRRRDAFGGRLELPFLETREPRSCGRRMALLPQTGEWVVFRRNDEKGVDVLFCADGFSGLCDAVIVLVA